MERVKRDLYNRVQLFSHQFPSVFSKRLPSVSVKSTRRVYLRSFLIGMYRVFSAQADWTLTRTSHKHTEQDTTEASITLDGVTLSDPLIR
jgi:hypothetical protein